MERYARNTALRELGKDGQKKLLKARVLVCGCGGLGSSVIFNLAATGVGHLGLVDCDVVELSNLNRQFIHKYEKVGVKKVLSAAEHVKEFNREINLNTFDLKLDVTNYQEVVKDYDIIVDCFDSYASKFLLNDIAIKCGKTLVHGGVSEFYGQASVVIPHKTACLRCFMPDADTSADIPKGVISPAVSTIGSIQSMEVFKLVTGIGKPLTDTLLTYNGLTQEFKKLKLSKNNNCNLCK